MTISYSGTKKTKESARVRGYLSAVDKTVHFGLGGAQVIDTVRVLWPSGKYQEQYGVSANATLTFEEKDASENLPEERTVEPWFNKTGGVIDFVHRENQFNDFEKEKLLPYMQSTQGPKMALGDVNGDGQDDLYVGGAHKQAGQLFLQAAGGFKKSKQQAFVEDADHEDMKALFLDMDGDGDQDLYVVSGGSEFEERSESLIDRIYLNDGKGNFSRLPSSEVYDYTISGKSVASIDYDRDGDLDLIVGNRIKPQQYPLHEPSLVYENVNGSFRNVTPQVAPDFEDFGMVNKVIATDINNDGWEDFIAVGEWTHIGIFLNENGVFRDVSGKSGLNLEKGWWFSVIETDVNNDGNKDYLVGNVGLNLKHKASPESPLRIYADDFDLNGTLDAVLSYQYNGMYVSAAGKEISTQQMPFLAKKTPTYNQFANSTLEDLYGDQVNTAYMREATQFRSLLLLNDGMGSFKKIPLPNRAQSIPILDADGHDLNGDGYEDLVVVGNIHDIEPSIPRLDNPFGLVLISNGRDGYSAIGPEKSGLYIDGNAKSVKLIEQASSKKVIVAVGVSNGPVETFDLSY